MVPKQAMFHPKNTWRIYGKDLRTKTSKTENQSYSIFIECKWVLTMHLKNADHGWCVMINSQLESSPHQDFQGKTKTPNTFWELKNHLRNAVSKLPKLQVALYDNVLKRRVAAFCAFTARTPNRHQEPGWSRWKRSGGLGARLESPKRRCKLRWMNGWNLKHKSIHNIEIHGAKEVCLILFGHMDLIIGTEILTYNCCTSISWSSCL